MTNYDIATRVPLIISSPGADSGKTSSFAELVDLYPTLCDLAGIEPPAHLEGDSLAKIIRGGDRVGKTKAESQYSRYNGKYTGRSIRTKGYRYVAWFDRSGKIVAEEYYDSVKDPGETTNIFLQLSEKDRAKVRAEAGWTE